MTGTRLRWMAALAVVLAGCRAEPPRPVRVVLITLDTLRQDAFAGGDGGSGSLPRTAARSKGGTIYTRFHAASNVTQASHASLFTSLEPWENGVTRNGQVLSDDRALLAEAFANAGFATGAVVSSFPVGRRFGFARGFARFEEVFERELIPGYREWEGEELPGGRFYSLSGPVTDAALDMLDSMEGERQFLWFHFFDAHDPYGDTTTGAALEMPMLEYFRAIHAPGLRPLLEKAHELYRADVASLDRNLDRLLGRILDEADRFDTHVMITADHGESFGEEGHIGHGESLGPQEIRVPLVVLSPGLEPGERSDVLGSVDLAPMILRLAGVASDQAVRPTGAAYGMQRTCRPGPVDPGLPPCEDGRFFAVIDGVLYAGKPGAVLRDDAAGSPAPPEIARSLGELFRRFAERAQEGPADELLDRETRERLRSLGY